MMIMMMMMMMMMMMIRILPKFNHFFFVHRHICGKVFIKIRSVVFT